MTAVPMRRVGPERVEANGIRIAYEEFGDADGEPLLLIMGLGMQMVSWDEDFCAMLVRRGFRVIRFDNRDVGLSERIAGAAPPTIREMLLSRMMRRPIAAPYSLEDMAADALGVLDALGIPAAHVVGASLGGMIAQLMAIHHPERVRSLTCVMSRASGDRSAGRPALRAAGLLWGRSPRTREGYVRRAQRVMRLLSGPKYPPDDARVRERAGIAWDRGVDAAGVLRQLAAEMTSGSRIEALRGVRVPTLVVHGDRDPLLPVQGGHQIAGAIPGAELLLIEGMGHTLPEAVWERVVEAIAAVAARASE